MPTALPRLGRLCLLALPGCGADPFDAIVVDQAVIAADGATHGMVGFLGGYSLANATLLVHETGGSSWTIPIALGGSLWGVGAELGVALFVQPELALPGGDLPVSDILGDYSGEHVAFGAALGVHHLQVRNAAGCTIDVFGFDLGVGMEAGGALFNMQATGDPVQGSDG